MQNLSRMKGNTIKQSEGIKLSGGARSVADRFHT